MPLLRTSTVPLPWRWVLNGAMGTGAVGGIVGLVLGLLTYPPTAVFAVVELGVPCAIIGGFVGLVSGTAAAAIISLRQR